MKSLFFALAFSDTLLVAGTAALGFFVGDRSGATFRLHFAAGLVTAIMLIFTHVAVFTYFIVTGKLIMRAGVAERVSPGAVDLTRGLKSRAVRFAVPGIVSVIVVTSTGALAHQNAAAALVHLVGFALTVTLNGIALAGEYACIQGNGRLLEATLDEYAGKDVADRPSPSEPRESPLASSRAGRYQERFIRSATPGQTGPAGG
jgi:hypothetical protein